ncbi:unnamed protein product, partial [Rotaria sp. Silwood1]
PMAIVNTSASDSSQMIQDLLIDISDDNPPNFNVKESLANYQTPMAIVNTSASDSSQMIQDLLIDISDDVRK